VRREEIDWPGLRAAAVAIGIRPAARQASRHLPPDERERFVQRAMKRCSREKWLAKAQQDKADAVVASPTALSANVRKGSDATFVHVIYEGEKRKAGEGNRTPVCSLGSCRSTIELHPRADFRF
jgi:methylphosphotriester-DNA--protein-cysteine methyltransferase